MREENPATLASRKNGAEKEAVLERNKAVARRIWLEGWNQGNLHVIEEVLGDNFLYHDPTIETPLEQAEFRRVIFRGLAAFPDIRFDPTPLLSPLRFPDSPR